MNSLVLSLALLVCALGLSAAQRGPPGDGPPGGRGGGRGGRGGRGRGPPHLSMLGKFAACKELDQAIREKFEEMWTSKQIGPEAGNCVAENKRECMMKDMVTVRCAVEVQPTPECIEEVMGYVKGTCDQATVAIVP